MVEIRGQHHWVGVFTFCTPADHFVKALLVPVTGVFRTQNQHSGNQKPLVITFFLHQKNSKQSNLQANSPHTVSGFLVRGVRPGPHQ